MLRSTFGKSIGYVHRCQLKKVHRLGFGEILYEKFVDVMRMQVIFPFMIRKEKRE